MRHLFLLCLLVLSVPVFAQSLNEYEAPTAEHQLISGTNIYMVPPLGFELTEQFKGFQNPTDATSMIMVISIPGPFDQITAGFAEETMAARGMKMLGKEKTTVNGKEGLLIEMDQDANGMTFTKSILIYGDAAETTMINGVALKDSVALFGRIKESVHSTLFSEKVEVDPRAELSFEVDETAGNLQFVSVMGNAIMLNRDGKIPTESEDKLNLIIDRSYADQDFADRKAFTLKRLAQFPGGYKIASEDFPREVSLAGLNGYELLAGKADEEELHLIILFEEDGGYFIIAGMYSPESEQAKTDFRAIMNTFKQR
ncbi:hypothetical protein [Neolewinella agarilytica]|uniref:hypothetical protein n=1 Tax=Neolewinella agarilytica TaxID=478744 RepID=UPI0023559E91|nr:hypothetical protein [Neolewinella agarilytica]